MWIIIPADLCSFKVEKEKQVTHADRVALTQKQNKTKTDWKFAQKTSEDDLEAI